MINITNTLFIALLALVFTGSTYVPTDQQIDVTKRGILPNDNIDDAVAINKLIASLPAGGTLYFPKGTYDLQQPVLLKSHIKISGAGKTAVTFRQKGSIAAWAQLKAQGIITTNNNVGNTDITVQGITVKGLYTKTIGVNGGGAKGGICLRNCRSSLIRDCIVYDTWLGAAFYDYDFKDNKSNNIIEGVNAYRARNFYNPGNSGSPRGILVNTPGSIIRNCLADACGTGFFASGENIQLVNCTARNWTIDNGYYIIVNNVMMTGCKAITGDSKKQGLGSGFAVAYCKGGSVTNCIARNCSNYGFRIHVPQSSLKISGNTAEKCGIGLGIDNASHPYPEVCEALEIKNNTSIRSSQQGFLFRQMKNSRVLNNTARNNNQSGLSQSTKGGIAIMENCSGSLFEDNVCDDDQAVKTQLFGLVNYSNPNSAVDSKKMRSSGATSNRIVHRSKFGKDEF